MGKYRLDSWWPAAFGFAVFCSLCSIGGYGLVLYALISALYQDNSSFARDAISDPDFLGMLLILYPVMAYTIWRFALSARTRTHRRGQAIAGAPDAMSVARLDSSAFAVHVVRRQPSVAPAGVPTTAIAADDALARIGWRTPRNAHWWLVSLLGIIGLCSLLIVPFVILVALGSVLSGIAALLVLAASMGICFALFVAGLRSLMNRQTASSRQPIEIVATHSGLRWRRPHQPDVVVRWADAALLEVWKAPIGGRPALINRLYGADGAQIVWPQFGAKAPLSYEADGMTAEELLDRQRDLFSLVLQRSGLTPRSFDLDLTDDKTATGAIELLSSFYAIFVVAIFSVLPALAAALFVVTPLTRYAAANWYAALTSVAVGVTCVTLVVRGRLRRVHQRRRAAEHQTPAEVPLPTPPHNTYEEYLFASRLSVRRRLAAALIGVLGMLDGVVFVLAYAAPGHTYLRDSLLDNVKSLLLSPLLLLGIVGICELWLDGLRPATMLYGVTGEGVAMRRNLHVMRVIPWREIGYIAVIQRARIVTGYEVIATDGVRIKWPARAVRWPPPRKSALARATVVTPDELAALVVARTGLTLQARQA